MVVGGYTHQAAADTDDDIAADAARACATASGNVALRACTQALQSKRLRGHALATVLVNRCGLLQEKGEFDGAIADCTEAIRLDPEDAQAYDVRGVTWRMKGDPDRAIADYDEAIRLDPDFFEAYGNRGAAWTVKGDTGRAIADFDEAIRLDPQDAGSYTMRGDFWLLQGDPDRAIADLTVAIHLDPSFVRAYDSRGQADFYKADFPAAAADFQRLIDLGVDPYLLLWRYLARGRAGESGMEELAANAGRLKSKDWPLPVIDFYLGRRSMNEMMSAVTQPDNRCDAQFFLGEWYLLHDNREEAARALRLAVDTCPKRSAQDSIGTMELKRLGP